MIPKRRNKDEILDEMEYEQNKRFNAVPVVQAGKNRKAMVTELQERFQYKTAEDYQKA